jgi:glycosyltransferase 2 family protein
LSDANHQHGGSDRIGEAGRRVPISHRPVSDAHTGEPLPGWTRRRNDAIAAAAGLAVLAAGILVVRYGTVPGWEERLFEAINDLPGWLYPLIWPIQQLGVLIVGPVVAIVAAVTRRFRLALAALLATGGKLVLEQMVKAMVDRQRPATSIGDEVELRGDVPTHGDSFPSGHAVLATTLASVIAPYLPARWRALPWVVVAIVMFARVYVGAHNPLDVICGAGLGLAIGSCINMALGVPAAGRARPAQR